MLKKFIWVFLISLAEVNAQLPESFEALDQPPPPDYALPQNWSALPFRNDAADAIKGYESWKDDSLKPVDVFYVYPTLYKNGKTWCADVNWKRLNQKIDNWPVRVQASVFNETARVYAPRYRQAVITSYMRLHGPGQQALDFAYEDVKRAFQYYMQHYNNGRPIIIASHSQGSTHCRRLIREFFDTPDKKKQLVCAYIIGFGVFREDYQTLKPCESPEETGCYVTWASFREGYQYQDTIEFFGDVCVNPASWTTDTADHSSINAGVLLQPGKGKRGTTSARIHENYLWVKTRMPFARARNNLHIFDYNLFWFDIRRNVRLRTEKWMRENP